MNRGELRERVRTLTGVWSVDVVTDALINSFLNDAVVALQRSQQWDTTGVSPQPTFTQMASDGTEPGAFWTEYHVILAYRVASQVLAFEADDTQRSQFFAQEYDKMYAEMVVHFFPRQANGTPSDTASMVRYVRDLTGQYGQDLSDNIVKSWLDEIYQDLFVTYDWHNIASAPPLASVTWSGAGSLRSNNPDAGIPHRYYPMFCYYVAAKMMASIPEAQARAAMYKQEYDRLLAAMLSESFPSATNSPLTNLAELVLHVRFLTQNYTRALNDQIIEQYLRDAQKELLNRNYWPNTVTSTFITGIPEDFRRVLSLRAAARILNGNAAEAQVAALVGEYEAVVEEMKTALVRNAALGAAASTTFSDLKRHVRMLTGVWDNTISDTAIGNWLNDAYTELAQDKEWPWLEQTATTDFNVTAGATTQALPNGTRRVMGVYFLGGNYDGVPDQWLAAPHLLDIEEYAPRTVYDIADDGVLRWAPELSESGILRVQYVRNVTAMSSDSDQPLFAARFRPILAYRAAMRWESMNGDKNRVQTFQSEFESMLEQMVNEYLLDHDTNPLQLGSEGLETRRYLPWFRTA